MDDSSSFTNIEGFGPTSAFSQNSWDDVIAFLIGVLTAYGALSNQVELDDACPTAYDPVTQEPYRAGQRPDGLRREEQIAFLHSLLVGLQNLREGAAEVILQSRLRVLVELEQGKWPLLHHAQIGWGWRGGTTES